MINGPSLITLTAAALADAVNPCGIAALVILLFTLLKSGKSHKVILIGFSYITGLFLAYFAFGLGIFQFLKISFLAPFLHWAIGSIGIYVGLKYIYDFFKKESECVVCETETTFRIFKPLQPIWRILIKDITSVWGAFILGALITLVEIPCTGGPYFFALGYIAQEKLRLIPYLLFYNLVTFSPLVLIVFALYLGLVTIEKTQKWRRKNLLKLQLIMGWVMVILGIYLIID